MNLSRRFAFIWSFSREKEMAYQEFTLPINFISLRLTNVLIIIGMTAFIFIDFFRDVNYSYVLASRLVLTAISLSVIVYCRKKRPTASAVDFLIAFSLTALVAFSFFTASFGHMPSFFLTNISVTTLVFVATISGFRFRHALLFNFIYLLIFIFYSQVFQRD